VKKLDFEKQAGMVIRKARLQKKYTQRGLAEKLGVAYQYIQKWEHGVWLPSLKHFLKLCKVLGLRLKDFDFDVDTK